MNNLKSLLPLQLQNPLHSHKCLVPEEYKDANALKIGYNTFVSSCYCMKSISIKCTSSKKKGRQNFPFSRKEQKANCIYLWNKFVSANESQTYILTLNTAII